MLTLLFSGFNLLLLLVIAYWAINKNCLICKQELPAKRIFAFKDKCPSCEKEGGKNND